MATVITSEDFLNELLKDEYLDFQENPVTRERMLAFIGEYYHQVEAAALIAAFERQKISDQKRNIILGAILAYDILRAPKENPEKFLKDDDCLSKQLISALIVRKNPTLEDPKFVKTVTAIFEIALCDPGVKTKFNGFLPSGKLSSHGIRDLRRAHNERPAKMRQYIKEIFPGPKITTFDSVTIAGNVLKYMDQITAVATTYPSYLQPNFAITVSRVTAREDCNGTVLWGSVIFSLGLLLALSTVVTALPSFGLSPIPSLTVGGGMMLLGGGMVIAGLYKCGIFSSPDKSSSTNASHSRDSWGMFP